MAPWLLDRPPGPLGPPWLIGNTLRLIACRLHIGPVPGDYRTMRRRPAPPPSAQQMIRDYLGRVSAAATKVLPKGDRLLFVGRTRAAIEARVGPLASADADEVMSALTTLGDPEDLAKRERERLYSARRRGAAAAPPALWKPAKAPRRGAARAAPARRPQHCPGSGAQAPALAPPRADWPGRAEAAAGQRDAGTPRPGPRGAAPGGVARGAAPPVGEPAPAPPAAKGPGQRPRSPRQRRPGNHARQRHAGRNRP